MALNLTKEMIPYRTVRHFVITLDKGKILISKAREVVPKHMYEVIQLPDLLQCPYEEKLQGKGIGIGLGETTKIKGQIE